ncbi:MAG: hypothetical protein ABIS47_07370 [Acidimicrobiales bacterium]
MDMPVLLGVVVALSYPPRREGMRAGASPGVLAWTATTAPAPPRPVEKEPSA